MVVFFSSNIVTLFDMTITIKFFMTFGCYVRPQGSMNIDEVEPTTTSHI